MRMRTKMGMRTCRQSVLALGVALVMGVPFAWAQAPAPKPAAEKPAVDKPVAERTVAKTGGDRPPGVVVADVVKLTATVEAVDKDKRTVTVKGSGGRTVILKAGESVKNFDQIKVGDKVKAEFVDALAVFVRKSGAPPDVAEAAAIKVAPRGQKPAAMAVETTEVTAKVESIDYAKRLATLKLPDGSSRTIKVDQRVKRLNEVKAGDEIVIRHTEALAIAVSKPAS